METRSWWWKNNRKWDIITEF